MGSKILIILMALTAGCLRTKSAVEKIDYSKDERTGICYAVKYQGQGLGLATVPCEKVEHLLDK